MHVTMFSIMLFWTMSVFNIQTSLETATGNMLPLGKQRLPERINVKSLKFSPGGRDFYERYIISHSPVLIKGAARNWPINGNWENVTHVYEIFTHEKLLVLDSTSEKIFGKIMEFKHKVDTVIPKDSRLLQGIFIPLVLQCNELVQKISSVRLCMNNDIKNNIQFATTDTLIASFATSQSVMIFGTNNSLSADDIKSVDTQHVDMKKYGNVVNIPYQVVDMYPGDILYLPIYSWYHIISTDGINYVEIQFDMFPYEFSKNTPNVKVLQDYKKFLVTQPQQIACSNTDITMREALTIDFNDEEAIMHLRIPKRNNRPEDIVLASGYKMPVLGCGTALLNETTYETVKYALTVGFRMFDTAYGYPHGEEGVGKAISESEIPRDQVFIVTKLHPKYLGYKETLFAIEESLKNLNTSYIDLFLIHSLECDDFLLTCDEGEPHGTWKETWRAMEHMHKMGKVRSLGVSNFFRDNIMELLKWSIEPVSVVQNWFDPYNQDVDTRQICEQYNIRYMGYSTLGSAWKRLGLSYNPVLESDMITAIAAHYDYVISHVVLRWAIHVNVTVIPRSGNRNHISQNIRSLDIKLHQSDIDSLNELNDWMEELQNNQEEPLEI